LRVGGQRDHAFAPRYSARAISSRRCSRTANACAPACCRAICCCRKASPAGAIEAWQRIEQQDPAYLALVAQRLLETYRKLERRTEGIALLRGYLERYPSLDLLDVVYQLVLESEGTEAAYRLVRAELQRNPTLLGLEKLMSARLPLATPEVRPDVELAKTIIQGYTKRLSRYRCDNCGFKARQFYWRCPACGGWETYPPRRSEEFDQTL
jgi:lipopolysaccharide biosynthesis regulator YciM